MGRRSLPILLTLFVVISTVSVGCLSETNRDDLNKTPNSTLTQEIPDPTSSDDRGPGENRKTVEGCGQGYGNIYEYSPVNQSEVDENITEYEDLTEDQQNQFNEARQSRIYPDELSFYKPYIRYNGSIYKLKNVGSWDGTVCPTVSQSDNR